MTTEAHHTTLLEGQFYFNPEDPVFQDHFPGNPVVPGSLIVHAFIQAYDGSIQGEKWRSVTNFRFKRFVPPGYYAFRMETTSDGRTACFLYDEDKIVVTGTL